MGMVNMKRDQGRKENEVVQGGGLKDELYLEPDIEFAKENKNKTAVKMTASTKIKENPNAKKEAIKGTTTEEVADLRKAIAAIKPKAPAARMMKPVVQKKKPTVTK